MSTAHRIGEIVRKHWDKYESKDEKMKWKQDKFDFRMETASLLESYGFKVKHTCPVINPLSMKALNDDEI